jgi:hypothetical protein
MLKGCAIVARCFARTELNPLRPSFHRLFHMHLKCRFGNHCAKMRLEAHKFHSFSESRRAPTGAGAACSVVGAGRARSSVCSLSSEAVYRSMEHVRRVEFRAVKPNPYILTCREHVLRFDSSSCEPSVAIWRLEFSPGRNRLASRQLVSPAWLSHGETSDASQRGLDSWYVYDVPMADGRLSEVIGRPHGRRHWPFAR